MTYRRTQKWVTHFLCLSPLLISEINLFFMMPNILALVRHLIETHTWCWFCFTIFHIDKMLIDCYGSIPICDRQLLCGNARKAHWHRSYATDELLTISCVAETVLCHFHVTIITWHCAPATNTYNTIITVLECKQYSYTIRLPFHPNYYVCMVLL